MHLFVSFFEKMPSGGMIAIEVAKMIETEKIIIISSAKTRKEIPFYYRWAGLLQLHKLTPASFFKRPGFLMYWFFKIKRQQDKKLLANILNDTDPAFLQWAIDRIISWKNTSVPAHLTHIHGTSDRVLPYRFVKADIPIKDGGHFMVVNKAGELSEILKKLIL